MSPDTPLVQEAGAFHDRTPLGLKVRITESGQSYGNLEAKEPFK